MSNTKLNAQQKEMLKNWEVMQKNREKMKGQKSRFYDQDRADFITHLMQQSDAQLSVTIARQNAINNVTRTEEKAHCQLSGLSNFNR